MKKVASVHRGPPAHWVGNGFHVRSLFMYDGGAEALSPFLLLDYAAPEHFPPSREPRGVGRHPHRGFETVTIAYQGGVEHRDSAGNHGVIGPGDYDVWRTKFGTTAAGTGSLNFGVPEPSTLTTALATLLSLPLATARRRMWR